MTKDIDRKRRFALRLGVSALATGGVALATAAALGEEPKVTPSEGPLDKGLGGLVGLKLRVVKPGQFVTQEYNSGRLTISVDAESRIQQVYIG